MFGGLFDLIYDVMLDIVMLALHSSVGYICLCFLFSIITGMVPKVGNYV